MKTEIIVFSPYEFSDSPKLDFGGDVSVFEIMGKKNLGLIFDGGLKLVQNAAARLLSWVKAL